MSAIREAISSKNYVPLPENKDYLLPLLPPIANID